jgi:hypothetical protein
MISRSDTGLGLAAAGDTVVTGKQDAGTSVEVATLCQGAICEVQTSDIVGLDGSK